MSQIKCNKRTKEKLRSLSSDSTNSSFSLDSKTDSYDSISDIYKIPGNTPHSLLPYTIHSRIREQKELLSSSPSINDALNILKNTEYHVKTLHGIDIKYDHYVQKYIEPK